MTSATSSPLFPRPPGASHFPAVPDSADAVLEGLDPEQREVATTLHGPVCVLAGAGTGKTRAITHRIAYGVRAGILQPSSVLAVTFTNRAAGELRGRLRQLGAAGVQARTFHSAALRQLQYFWPRAVGGTPLPELLERKPPLVAEAAGAHGFRLDRNELRDVSGEIEWAKVTQTIPEQYPLMAAKAARETPRDPAEIARVYESYERLKHERGLIDFEDVLLLTVGVLQSHSATADEVRSQYRHFVVDEYQDVNPLQQRLLDLWLGDRDSLCVVGDASQTIYSFTGATPDYLLGFRNRHPGATVVKLVRDYRSTPQVVRLANDLLAQARGRTAEHRLELQSQRDPGPAPDFTEYGDEVAEAEGTARRVRQLIDSGTPASEIAVLYRVNAQSAAYEQAFAHQGVPYQLRGAERFFDRPEVKSAWLLLRGAAHSGGSADPELERLDIPGTVRHLLRTQRGWEDRPPAGSGATRDQWESLAALVRLAEDFARARPDARLADLVAEIRERAEARHAPTVEGVTLASLHAAKGLEWDAVFLVGLTEGMMPIIYAETDEQIEEERRLLYVGVTRARALLTLSWALSRTPGGRPNRTPSRFLDGLRPGSGRRAAAGPALADGGSGVTRGEPRQPAGGGSRRRVSVRCRVCGRTLTDAGEMKLMRCEDCPSELDEGLYQRLRDWRAARARELRQPEYCVFTDKTLLAIAETVPGSPPELAAIPGVIRRKLDRYGEDVLALCAGGDPPEPAAGEPFGD
ncbi:ATP-dependent DNA helicase UvrD2 [Streptomyces sp. Ru87]|uniref:ATP-dependent DNA helicase UvrD2 n=1 Tax=Streptomyces sp. Ru87 TaxID=2044307 RepID=UPI000BF33FED|nr:ATP-dependent DNA helicase UvrD2 [Streptomyces sp. Ru87]PGH52368.1 ATP-dependent DNA helicase [Streptomyces sp. Ru87]